MANLVDPNRGKPGFPPPSTALPLDPGEDPLPEPVGVLMPGHNDMPPMNEPLGIPGGMPPEIIPFGAIKEGAWSAARDNLR